MWTIYDHPRDFPHSFVVRGFTIRAGVEPIPDQLPKLADTLDQARQHVPPGLYRMERQVDDDPNIVETWL